MQSCYSENNQYILIHSHPKFSRAHHMLTHPLMLPSSFFFRPACLYTFATKGAILGDVVSGGQGCVVLTNVLLGKDDMLWLRVPDWSRGELFIHLFPPEAAAASTSSCLLLCSPLFPSCPGLGCRHDAGSWPSVAAVIGSAGVEKQFTTTRLPHWMLEERERWLKTGIPCCFILCVQGSVHF